MFHAHSSLLRHLPPQSRSIRSILACPEIKTDRLGWLRSPNASNLIVYNSVCNLVAAVGKDEVGRKRWRLPKLKLPIKDFGNTG